MTAIYTCLPPFAWPCRYAYTRDVPVDPSTIIQLLPAADRFQMEGLLRACCQALVKELTLDNCMQIRAFAKAFAYR
jgi:hypothetical protein